MKQRVCPTPTHELGLVLHQQQNAAGGVQGEFSTGQNIPVASRGPNSKTLPSLTSPGKEEMGDKASCLSEWFIPVHQGNFISKIDKIHKREQPKPCRLVFIDKPCPWDSFDPEANMRARISSGHGFRQIHGSRLGKKGFWGAVNTELSFGIVNSNCRPCRS